MCGTHKQGPKRPRDVEWWKAQARSQKTKGCGVVEGTSKVPKDQGMWSGGRHKEGHTYASTQGNSKRAIGHPYIEIKRNLTRGVG